MRDQTEFENKDFRYVLWLKKDVMLVSSRGKDCKYMDFEAQIIPHVPQLAKYLSTDTTALAFVKPNMRDHRAYRNIIVVL